MNDRLRSLRNMTETVTGMRLKGNLADAEYKKALMCIAHDLIELGQREEAISLVGRLDDEYVDNVLPVQMDSEPVFRLVAVGLGKMLVGGDNPVDVELEQALLLTPKVHSKPC